MVDFFQKWFVDIVKNHYADFEGRVRRQTYWMFYLSYLILSVALGVVGAIIGSIIGMWFYLLVMGLAGVAMIVPVIALGVRRLHDIGKSGWWYLIVLIPLIGTIGLIVLLATDSQPGANKYGENPKGM